LTLSEIDSRSFSISWNEYSNEHWNGEKGAFRIELFELHTGNTTITAILNSNSTYVEIFSLHPNYTYIFKIAAYNTQGTSNFSEAYIKLSEDGMPTRHIIFLFS